MIEPVDGPEAVFGAGCGLRYQFEPLRVGFWYAEAMTNHTYRVIEIVGTSPDGVDTAIRNGLARAADTTRNLDWFEVQSIRGHLENGAIGHVQVTMKVGFRIEDTDN
jgi:flavin-binding protein dodecin